MNDESPFQLDIDIGDYSTKLTEDIFIKSIYPYSPYPNKIDEIHDEVESIACGKCGSDDHNTREHIIGRIVKYNIIITSDSICTKCLGNNHLRKYCDIYNSVKNIHNDTMTEDEYYEYLDQIYNFEKNRLMIDYCKNDPKAKEILKNFDKFSIEDQIYFLFYNDHFPKEGLQPFWDIIYKQHSIESIEKIKMKYYD